MAKTKSAAALLGVCVALLWATAHAADSKDGFNLFKDYLRTGKEFESFLPGPMSPKFLYFYRAAPSLLEPEAGGTKRNQLWRSVGRKELDEALQDSPGAAAVRELESSFRPIAARTFLAKRDVSGSGDEPRSKKAIFSWTVEPRRVVTASANMQRYPPPPPLVENYSI